MRDNIICRLPFSLIIFGDTYSWLAAFSQRSNLLRFCQVFFALFSWPIFLQFPLDTVLYTKLIVVLVFTDLMRFSMTRYSMCISKKRFLRLCVNTALTGHIQCNYKIRNMSRQHVTAASYSWLVIIQVAAVQKILYICCYLVV